MIIYRYKGNIILSDFNETKISYENIWTDTADKSETIDTLKANMREAIGDDERLSYFFRKLTKSCYQKTT